MNLRKILIAGFLCVLPAAAWACNPFIMKNSAGTPENFASNSDGGGNCFGFGALYDSAGANLFPVVSSTLDTVATPTTTKIRVYPSGYNGTTWDALRTVGAGVLKTDQSSIGGTAPLSAGVAGALASGGNQATNNNVSTNLFPTLIAGSDYSGTPKIQNLKVSTSGVGIIGGNGTAGAAATDVVTVQGIASMTPFLVNPGTAANWAVIATGSAPPANALYLGANASGATGGLVRGLITCDQHAVYDASDNGSITLVTGVAGRKVYVCGYILGTGGTATNLALKGGTNANCAAGAYALTPVYQMLANDVRGGKSAFWDGMASNTAADFVCINASAANAHQAEIWYTIL